ncbi:hypothetical protein HPB50_018375 [Hyalomma asiaticum]|uniref:Uncharacterized protein n=1 Tax=Hyalomma asiaticum TaxID=266040 RepID=A0ACB7TPM9_HYAAI|nr:hypothetical protein HPB50_018375 [Hyalomma asiaticum]
MRAALLHTPSRSRSAGRPSASGSCPSVLAGDASDLGLPACLCGKRPPLCLPWKLSPEAVRWRLHVRAFSNTPAAVRREPRDYGMRGDDENLLRDARCFSCLRGLAHDLLVVLVVIRTTKYYVIFFFFVRWTSFFMRTIRTTTQNDAGCEDDSRVNHPT